MKNFDEFISRLEKKIYLLKNDEEVKLAAYLIETYKKRDDCRTVSIGLGLTTAASGILLSYPLYDLSKEGAPFILPLLWLYSMILLIGSVGTVTAIRKYRKSTRDLEKILGKDWENRIKKIEERWF